MANLTRYARKAIIDATLGKATFPTVSQSYLALCLTNPTETGSLAGEVSGNGYARMTLGPSMSAADLVSGRAVNSALIQPSVAASAEWGLIPYFAICDAASGGNVWWYGAFATAMHVYTGDRPPFSEGSIIVTLK